MSNTTDCFTGIEIYMVIALLRRILYSNILQSINLYNIGYSVLIRHLVLDDFITVKFGIWYNHFPSNSAGFLLMCKNHMPDRNVFLRKRVVPIKLAKPHHITSYWSSCTKPGRWVSIYLCVKSYHFGLFLWWKSDHTRSFLLVKEHRR